MTTSERALALLQPSEITKEDVVQVGNKQFVLVKSVTRRLLKGFDNQIVYCTFTGPITREEDKDGNPIIVGKMPAPYVVALVDLTDGIEKDFLVPVVLQKRLVRDYPDRGYIGKSFAIKRTAPEGGKRYSNFEVAEIAEV